MDITFDWGWGALLTQGWSILQHTPLDHIWRAQIRATHHNWPYLAVFVRVIKRAKYGQTGCS